MTIITPAGKQNFVWSPKQSGLTKTAGTGTKQLSDKDLLYAAAKKVVKEFIKKNNNFYKGNLNNLRKFIKKLKTNKINYTSHQNYKNLEEHIVLGIN